VTGADVMSDTVTDDAAVDDQLVVTEKAAKEFRQILSQKDLPEDTAMRLSVKGGGCSGFEYGLEVDEDPAAEDDLVVESQGVRMLMDPFSAQYLAGIVIGYHSSFKGSGFTFENPNATGSCGCGTSFSV